MTDDDQNYFNRFPDFYRSILHGNDLKPSIFERRRSIEEECEEDFKDSYDGYAALRSGVAKGMEWAGWTGSHWAKLVYQKRRELGREINAQEEAEIRKICWADHFTTVKSHLLLGASVPDDDDLKFMRYLLGELPWPRDPKHGSFKNQYSSEGCMDFPKEERFCGQVRVIDIPSEKTEYFKTYPDFYTEILREVTMDPELRQYAHDFRRAVEIDNPNAYKNADDLRSAHLSGATRGMEWAGRYGALWGTLVFTKRRELGREITAAEEKEIRKLCSKEYFADGNVLFEHEISNMHVSEENLDFVRYFVDQLPWPREPNVGSFLNSHSSKRAMLRLFELNDLDKTAIEAALRFGDWIARQPEATESDKKKIALVQESLRRLPEVTPMQLYSYEVTFSFGQSNYEPEEPALTREWAVDNGANDLNRTGFGIYSVCLAAKDPGEEDCPVIKAEFEFENSFEIDQALPDKVRKSNGVICGSVERWIAEVESLDQLRTKPHKFEIQVRASQLFRTGEKVTSTELP